MPDDEASELLERARRLLRGPAIRHHYMPALAAAAFFAVSAICFAAVSVLAPPTTVSPMARSGAR